jgi:hypothetical protein
MKTNPRPTGNLILCRQIHPDLETGVIHKLADDRPFSEMEVIAKGPKCYGVFDVGDVLWVHGYKSGIRLEGDYYFVSEDICVAVVEKEKD